ncbi:MAG: M43 family zinc metalloprotease [Bacteroidota bacterium]
MQAQALAGDEQIHLAQYQNDPIYQRRADDLEAATYQELRKASPSNVRSVLTIPVVVHIMHPQSSTNPGDPGHPTDLQIEQGINWLNAAFRNQGDFAGGPFYSTAAQLGIQSVDTEIEFCLAKLAPDGSATSGITRTGTSYTNVAFNQVVAGTLTEDQILKTLAFWDSRDYLNLWIVNSVCEFTNFNCNIPGYAYLPGAHGTALDGVVLEEQFFGTTSEKTAVGVYYFARYLNLWRTSYKDLNRPKCDNADCSVRGDRVCDTPPDSTLGGPAVCGTLENSCDSDSAHADPALNPFFQKDVSDIYENFMDQGGDISCKNTFTQGQKLRMRVALQTTRQSLLAMDRCTEPKLSIRIESWESPEIIHCDPNLTPRLHIRNTGSLEVSKFTLQVALNGQIEDINWQGTLASGDLLSLDLNSQSLSAGSYTYSSEWISLNEMTPDPQYHTKGFYSFWVADASVPPVEESSCINLENGSLPPRWKPALLNAPIETQVMDLTSCLQAETKALRIAKAGNTSQAQTHWVIMPGPVVDPNLAPMQKLSFDWAHKYVDSLGSIKAMILAMPLDDCSEGIDTVWQAANSGLNTAVNAVANPDINWWPQDCQDWQTQEVDLSPWIQNKRQLIFAFGFSDQYLLPAYMDNICWEGQKTCPEGLEIPQEAGTYQATYLCQDDEGWTHFVKAADASPVSEKDQLLFSVLVPQAAAMTLPAEALQLVITDSASYQIEAPYVQNNIGFHAAGRYVELAQELSLDGLDFRVRFYFDQALPEGMAQNMGLTTLDPALLVAYTSPIGLDASPQNGQLGIDSLAYTEYLSETVDATHGWSLQAQGDYYSASISLSQLAFMGMGSDALGYGFGARYPQPFASFNGRQAGTANQLKWISHRELLAASFEILHSTDGQIFSSVAILPAKGIDTLLLDPSEYAFQHEEIEVGSHFYTILMHHSNGYTIASDTIAIRYDLSKLVNVYPNPLQSRLTIDPEFEWSESLTLQLFDSRHMVFLRRDWTQPGEELSVELPNIPPGIYFFQVHSGELKIQGKLLKTP